MSTKQRCWEHPRHVLTFLRVEDGYDVCKVLGNGAFGKVVLGKGKSTGESVALKLIDKRLTKENDFFRELNISYFLSVHPNILNTYNVAFQSTDYNYFAQEYAPFGDVFHAITPHVGLSEVSTKSIFRQVVSALQFVHSYAIVHRDVKPENILVFNADFARVKLGDFGLARQEGILMRKSDGCIPYTPPEIVDAVRDEGVEVDRAEDSWSLAVMLFCILTGKFPWQHASLSDRHYYSFHRWQTRKTSRVPPLWTGFSVRLLKFFRRALHHKPSHRAPVTELAKYWSDRWTLARKGSQETDDASSVSSVESADVEHCYCSSALSSQRSERSSRAVVLSSHRPQKSPRSHLTVDSKYTETRVATWLFEIDV